MSTPLIILAVVLALCTFIFIPLMMYRGGRKEQEQAQDQDLPPHTVQGRSRHKKKKKR